MILTCLPILLFFILAACGKPSDKLEGDWVSTNPETTKVFGKEFSFKDHNFKSKQDGIFIKYYSFTDDNEKNINFYDEKPSDNHFDKNYPSEEGILKIEGDEASITTEFNGEMTFERKK
ncbi:hypothetical protein [Mammaliicoccus lentus]|uniref:hypothetical protein n=1 Tax=Mammaliicoccus lentus TaxID=42858 RepID=UPI001C4F9A02|nr:hypothetical protein [Mammaliicoccus lentus]MBW0768700.1 hypothetical protein [Mammaliicoccus lentus]